jgi:NAD(P)-dependent dehydrogenase (short-subunit alcohol dehydrogenase family)
MKTFLSIGSGPGIGFATAERFAREGFRVVLSARNAANTKELAAQLNAKGNTAEARTVDATDPSSVSFLIGEVEKQFGAIDVLHYNAAPTRKATLAEQPRDSFNADFSVSVGGALVAVQDATAIMSRVQAGTILLTGSGYALQPNADYISLSVGKAGIRALALGLFESLKEKNIHVATVTVAALVVPGSRAAEEVAQQFWQLHNEPKDSWSVERMYAG